VKWLGQHIFGLAARFRYSVFFEKIFNHGSDPDRFLTMNSSTGQVTYRTGTQVAQDIGAVTTEVGDITGVTAGTGLSGGGTTGAVTLNVNATQTGITVVGTLTELTASSGEGGTPVTFVLPTEDPLVVNRLWNDSGTVKISAGE